MLMRLYVCMIGHGGCKGGVVLLFWLQITHGQNLWGSMLAHVHGRLVKVCPNASKAYGKCKLLPVAKHCIGGWSLTAVMAKL